MNPTASDRKALIRLAASLPTGSEERKTILASIHKQAARPLYEIAADIVDDWGASKVNYAAKPYLEAMFDLGSINDSFGYDSGDSIVRYFLSNARSWRGPVAKQIKAELKKML